MKKQFILSGLAVTAVLTASAQIADMPSLEPKDSYNLSVTPSYLAADNVPFSTLIENDNYIVYNEALQLVKRFAWTSEQVQYTWTNYTAIPTFDTSEHTDGPLADGYRFTQTTAQEYISGRGDYIQKIEGHGDETWFVTFFYDIESYGQNLPVDYYVLKSDGKLYSTHTTFGEKTGYSDKWEKCGKQNHYDYSRPCDIFYKNSESGSDNRIYLSQTLFNNDDKYEYIVPVYTYGKEEYLDIDPDYNQPCSKSVYEGDMFSGYKLVNNEGTVLQTVNFPPMTANTGEALNDVIVQAIGKYTYIVIGGKLYRIDKGSSSLAEVNMPSGIKVSPRVTPRTMPVNVTLGESGTERTVTVAGSNGMTYTTIRVAPGANSATIDTSRMPAGMYVVTVSENGRNTENCKIVVR